ncbi:MAG TPA: flagellar hook-associated protein FlgK [Acidobacteriaceae bacterium]|nr:flagellar hook-associated protein FlgK [Acidobacteriaceae bacterium]
MIGLNGTLSIATEALGAQTAGLEVANNNIANANTPGYSRQIVSLSSAASIQNGTSVDEGVSYDGFTSVRDSVLSLAINNATSGQGSLTAQNTLLTQVNTAFSSATSGVGASLSTLFSDLSALSTNPSDPSARQTVLQDANQLVSDFHQGAAALSSVANAANEQVVSSVSEINGLTQQIADLNAQLASSAGDGQDGGSLEDQRDALTTQVAQLIGISNTQTGGSPTLTTANGSPLVIGSTFYPLQVTTGSDGNVHVQDAEGDDITSTLTGGTLGGVITVRDGTLPSLSAQLDSLASQFAAAMNSAQASGVNLHGAAGSPMFGVPTAGSAAAGISAVLTNGSEIAISSDGSTNSSGNLQAFLSVQSSPLASGATPTVGYANLVGNIGSAGSQVSNELTATTASLQQLTTQQASESGVSIDEETTNLIRYQQAYQAAARVISTVNDLYTALMNISLGDG